MTAGIDVNVYADASTAEMAGELDELIEEVAALAGTNEDRPEAKDVAALLKGLVCNDGRARNLAAAKLGALVLGLLKRIESLEDRQEGRDADAILEDELADG